LVLALAGVLTQGMTAGQSRDVDAEEILRMHRAVLQAYVMAGRGEITKPTKAERAARIGPYLSSTTFEEYKDLVEPIIRISKDGTMGWLVAQVKIAGVRVGENDEKSRIDSVWAWIELYEKRDGKWLRVGNVSNRRPEE
jgi:hypothetical protein